MKEKSYEGIAVKIVVIGRKKKQANLIEVFKILCKGIRFDEWGKGSKAITLLN